MPWNIFTCNFTISDEVIEVWTKISKDKKNAGDMEFGKN